MSKTNSPMAYVLSILVAAGVTTGVLFCFKTTEQQIDDEYASFKNLTTTQLVEKFVKEKESDAKLAAVVEMMGRDELELTVPVFAKSLMIGDELMRTAGSTALQNLGEKAVPYLQPFFDSDARADFFAGCESVKAIGPAAKVYLPKAVEGLDHASRGYRMAALFALSAMQKEALPYRDKVISLIDDDDLNVRLWACRVLITMGKDAAPAAPKLINLLETGVPSDKGLACLALGSIGVSEDYDVVELLSNQLEARTQPEKERALQALGSIGPAAIAAEDKIKLLIEDQTKHCVVPASVAYWQVTGKTEPSISALTAMMDDISYRSDAVAALSAFGEHAKPALDKLITSLEDEDEVFREGTVITLGELGATSSPALKKLTEIMNLDPDRWIRYEAEQAIKKIKSAGK